MTDTRVAVAAAIRLSKSVVLLDLDGAGPTLVSFVDTEDGTHWLDIPVGKWKDFGSPIRVTVTVEPGDQLNEH